MIPLVFRDLPDLRSGGRLGEGGGSQSILVRGNSPQAEHLRFWNLLTVVSKGEIAAAGENFADFPPPNMDF